MKNKFLSKTIIREVSGIVIFILAEMLLYQLPIKAQMCMPVTNSSITVDGIVVGTAVAGGGALPVGCSVDAGWQNVIGQNFTVFGAPGTASAKIFVAGYNAVADATLDKIYIGVHVEGDPELDLNDRLVIYFHAGGTATWSSVSDFALLYEVGSMPPPSDETCNQNYGSLQFYRYSGGTWTPQASVPAGIVSKVSRDYDPANDGESEIWELEISIDLASMALNIPSSGTGFGLGAKLYVNQTTAGLSTAWIWPNNLTTESNPLLYDPAEGNVTPDKLVLLNTGNCADVTFDPDNITGVTATDNNGNSNVFTRLGSGDFSGQTPLKHNHFTARVKLYNPSNPSDNSPLTMSNVGNVNFNILPWNAGFLGTYLMNNPLINFTHLNQIETVQFDWPQTKDQYDNPTTHQPKNDLSASSHTCLDVKLAGFNPNSDITNDASWRNLTYATSSTIKDTFLISAPPGNNSLKYIMRVNWHNLPSDEALSDLASTYTSDDKAKISRAAMTTTSVIVDRKDMRHGQIQKWDYKITNARDIGLRNIGKGYYSMMINPGEKKYVIIEILGGTMPAASKQYTLSAKAGGVLLTDPTGDPTLNIDVKPGKMITIISHGLINVDPKNDQIHSNSPNGFSEKNWKKLKFLLKPDYYEPAQNIGTIIGSFDNFHTAFVIGADMTFLVPQDANTLSLAINDIAGGYGNNTGQFELNIVMTEPLFLPTHHATTGNPAIGVPALFRAGRNLPELDINVYRAVDFIDNKQAKLMIPTGYVAYGIYNSHPDMKPALFELVFPYVGYFIFDKKLGLDNGITIGGRLGHNFANGISVEGEGGITFTKTTTGGKSGTILHLLANVRYDLYALQLQQMWLVPYITGGVGCALLNGFGSNDGAVIYQCGAGVTLEFNSWLGLRVDGRYFGIRDVKIPGAIGINGKAIGTTGQTSSTMITAGLVFWF